MTMGAEKRMVWSQATCWNSGPMRRQEENEGEFMEIWGVGRIRQTKLKKWGKTVFLNLTVLNIKIFNIIKQHKKTKLNVTWNMREYL